MDVDDLLSARVEGPPSPRLMAASASGRGRARVRVRMRVQVRVSSRFDLSVRVTFRERGLARG